MSNDNEDDDTDNIFEMDEFWMGRLSKVILVVRRKCGLMLFGNDGMVKMLLSCWNFIAIIPMLMFVCVCVCVVCMTVTG